MENNDDESGFYKHRQNTSHVWNQSFMAHHHQPAVREKLVDLKHAEGLVVKVNSTQGKDFNNTCNML